MSTPITEPIPWTPRLKKAVALAIKFAKNGGDNYIGCEHILLGILAEGGSEAIQVLESAKVDLPALSYGINGILKARRSPSQDPDFRENLCQFMHSRVDGIFEPLRWYSDSSEVRVVMESAVAPKCPKCGGLSEPWGTLWICRNTLVNGKLGMPGETIAVPAGVAISTEKCGTVFSIG